ncbi:MAG: hypothetical protein Ct9H300mP31_15910 [Acidimicrobiaceae bacterium]|nr:MAG: hypothetical protein Ct9H300mP31_15910 [Acidimicrobiaceae bacterium]
MTKIAVIGTGYVGLTTGACFAHWAMRFCAGIDEEKDPNSLLSGGSFVEGRT